MADSDLAGFGFDPRAMRYPYSPRIPWPTPTSAHHINSSPQRPTIGANASAVERSTTPLPNQNTTIQPMGQQCQLRPHSQGQEQAYSHLIGHQNGLPSQIQTQNHLQFDQQPGQQNAFPTSFQNQPPAYNQQMNPPENTPANNQSNPTDWSYQQPPSTSQPFPLNTTYTQTYSNQAYISYGSSPVNFLSEQNNYATSVAAADGSYLSLDTDMEAVPFTWGEEFSNAMMSYPNNHGQPDMSMINPILPNSPTDTSLEVRSLSSSDNGWGSVEYTHGFDGSFPDSQAIFNPGQTLHCRTFSDSSYSDIETQRLPLGDFIEIPQHAISSPSTDSAGDHEFHHDLPEIHDEVSIKHENQPSPMLTSSTTAPIKIKLSKSPQRSPMASRRTSPPGRRPPRKNSMKTTKGAMKRQSQVMKGDTEKRIGRRKGPLSSEQRKQACEIRKLGACLRCKFLKKTVSST